ncbi:MAG TPA: hypothetical protein VNM72_15915 [Blastocatellia bacterium]|nr:hypothetical protein [Blastocatellia bacterium]
MAARLQLGYSSNEIGFGWTNAAIVELLADLPDAEKRKVREPNGIGFPR